MLNAKYYTWERTLRISLLNINFIKHKKLLQMDDDATEIPVVNTNEQ